MNPDEPINQPDPMTSTPAEPVNPPPAMDITPPSEPPTPVEMPAEVLTEPSVEMPIAAPSETPVMASLENLTTEQPQVPTEIPPTSVKSSKRWLIILISAIVVLLVTTGVVLAVFLLNKEEDKPTTNNSSTNSSTGDPSTGGSSTVDPDKETGVEKMLACRSTMDMTVGTNDNVALDMGILMYFDTKGMASKMVYEYVLTSGQKATEAVMAQAKTAVEQQFATFDVAVTGELTSDGAIELTITDKTGDKLTLTNFGYSGNNYEAGKAGLQRECATISGSTFEAP
ncbi:hypothetical protein FWC31_03530 [Candidatus Saccharibacteria bacterium]|nr:hypothetical protein [Candidatus Saccharibacteria bacterium]